MHKHFLPGTERFDVAQRMLKETGIGTAVGYCVTSRNGQITKYNQLPNQSEKLFLIKWEDVIDTPLISSALDNSWRSNGTVRQVGWTNSTSLLSK